MTIEMDIPLISRSMNDPVMAQTVKENADYAAYEARRPNEAWPHPNRPLYEVECAFMTVYPDFLPRAPGALSIWLKNEIARGVGAYVFNAMGGTNMLEDLALSNSLSAGIAGSLSKHEDPYLTERNILSVGGDILTRFFWDAVDEDMKICGIPGFQAIFFYPQNGGLNAHLTPYPNVSLAIYSMLYDRLIPGGILFAEQTEAIRGEPFDRLAKTIYAIDPSAFVRSGEFFSFIKTPTLPSFPAM